MQKGCKFLNLLDAVQKTITVKVTAVSSFLHLITTWVIEKDAHLTRTANMWLRFPLNEILKKGDYEWLVD